MDADKQQMMEDVASKLREMNEIDMLEQFLKDNVNEFIFKDKHYRVRKPNSFEKEQANKERMKKYFNMLKDPAYMFRKSLIELYKSKGIDIEGIEKEIKNLFCQEQGLLKKLYGNEDPHDIELLETEITNIRKQQQELFIQKEELLKYCIEQQLEDFLKFYLVYLVLEVKNGDTWEKVYKSFDDYMTSPDDILQAKATQVFALMLYNETL